jgi:squalene-associated FAD-dependent desaturase
MMAESRSDTTVVVVGGGLAGMAAAAALVTRGFVAAGGGVTLVEARRQVGGRAASFEDPAAGDLVDACQHVALGCCTNFLDLCRQTGIAGRFRRDQTLWFIGPDGVRAACRAWRFLPAPLHLLPLLGSMRHFSIADKLNLALGMLAIARPVGRAEDPGDRGVLAWLEAAGQRQRVIELFWRPVIESAVGESLELVALAAARKVIVDGFLAHASAIELHVPLEPLGSLFGGGLAGWLADQGVAIETGTTATEITRTAAGSIGSVAVQGVGGSLKEIRCRGCILAVPWKQAARLVPDVVPVAAASFAGSPITAVHLWFDRQVVDLPHAVLVGRLSQWVFRPDDSDGGGYCQVVISASRSLAGMDRQEVVDRVVAELKEVFPAARAATLQRARVVTDPTAVLSVRPGVDRCRPVSATAVPGLFLAGDWTATGWPSTMEGAVRSGRLAADAALEFLGQPGSTLVPDLPRNPLIRLLAGP